MPELSRFYGVIIRMFYERGGRHNMPHIHAVHGGFDAVFNIETSQLIAGTFPSKERKMVEVWIELRRSELRANWTKINFSSPPSFTKIEPLK